jgi:hypothetical protein
MLRKTWALSAAGFGDNSVMKSRAMAAKVFPFQKQNGASR